MRGEVRGVNRLSILTHIGTEVNLGERLLDTSKPFSKEYLQLLVKEIVLNGDSVRIKGEYVSLAGAIKFAAKKRN